MDFSQIKELMDQLSTHNIPRSVLENFELTFDIEYAHHSTAMEGNTLTLVETKAIIEDGISVGGKKLREIYEVANHNKAFNYAKEKIADGCPLDENLVKDFHEILMENIIQGGIYRNHDVSITGASHTPPPPNEMYAQIKYFYREVQEKNEIDPIELAAWTHAEFVRIHPFPDGNGRTSRLIMNYQLMSAGLLPINIRTENRIQYYDALDKYASERDLIPFAELVAEVEESRIRHYLSIEFEPSEDNAEQKFEQKM
ncbi:MAG: Fic family protein [Ruminococcaceae bacterium]|nr:Fic family protein [Oscillospiraceae bacterium]